MVYSILSKGDLKVGLMRHTKGERSTETLTFHLFYRVVAITLANLKNEVYLFDKV